MRRRRRVAALLAPIALILLTGSGCDVLSPEPCAEVKEEGLDGKWFLKSVNSQGPTTDAFNVIGWPVPGSDRRLTPNTTLEFRTEEWPGCQDESRLYSGTVIGRYLAYRQSAPSQNSYTGRFEYLHTSGHITLYAFGLGLEGKRDGWISIYGLAPYTSDADRLAFAKEE